MDFRKGQYRIPSKRRLSYHEIVGKVLYGDGRVNVKILARIAGQAHSFRVALGQVVSFDTRHMYVAIKSCTSRWQVIDVPHARGDGRVEKVFFHEFRKMLVA